MRIPRNEKTKVGGIGQIAVQRGWENKKISKLTGRASMIEHTDSQAFFSDKPHDRNRLSTDRGNPRPQLLQKISMSGKSRGIIERRRPAPAWKSDVTYYITCFDVLRVSNCSRGIAELKPAGGHKLERGRPRPREYGSGVVSRQARDLELAETAAAPSRRVARAATGLLKVI
jgi:hypothetical protein